jgi:hypothetical protein
MTSKHHHHQHARCCNPHFYYISLVMVLTRDGVDLGWVGLDGSTLLNHQSIDVGVI